MLINSGLWFLAMITLTPSFYVRHRTPLILLHDFFITCYFNPRGATLMGVTRLHIRWFQALCGAIIPTTVFPADSLSLQSLRLILSNVLMLNHYHLRPDGTCAAIDLLVQLSLGCAAPMLIYSYLSHRSQQQQSPTKSADATRYVHLLSFCSSANPATSTQQMHVSYCLQL